MTSLQSLDFLHRLGGPIIVTNLEGLILHWSPAAEEALGFSGDEMKLRNWWEHLPPATREQIKSALAGPKPDATFAGTCAIKNKAGSIVNLVLHVSPLNGEGRQPQALLTMFHLAECGLHDGGRSAALPESSQTEQSREAVYQARKTQAIGALAGGLAHDFNNILTAILSYLDLVLLAPELPASMHPDVVHAKTSAVRAAELVSRLLSFSRQARPNLLPLRLGPLFDEVFVTLRRSIDSRIQIRPPEISPDIWTVNGDASQLMQLLTNLCLNARDAMPNGGTLFFELANVTFPPDCPSPKRPGDFVKLTVGDTGKGISAQVLNRLFEAYFTTKEFGKGTGLGLAIVNSIATEHGGWMEVESEAGKGSRFHAHFPRSHDTSQPSEEASREALTANNTSLEGKETILIADDEEMVRLVARAVLGYRGYTIAEAVDGEEALQKFSDAQGRIDLVLLDLHMPKLDGWETLARLQTVSPQTPVIVLSGGSTDEFAEKIESLGAAGLMQKPFDNLDLLREVRRTLDSARQRKGST